MGRSAFAVWRRVDIEAIGHGSLRELSDGDSPRTFRATGMEVAGGRRPHAVSYVCEIGENWRFQLLTCLVDRPGAERFLVLERDGAGAWRSNRRRRRDLDGCVDVDVAAAPLTNTFPIRRLRLAVGQEAVIRVAWVDVPSLRVSAEEQGYRRIGPVVGSDGLEAYEFWPVGGRTYRLTVDPDGLVVDYEDLARRIG